MPLNPTHWSFNSPVWPLCYLVLLCYGPVYFYVLITYHTGSRLFDEEWAGYAIRLLCIVTHMPKIKYQLGEEKVLFCFCTVVNAYNI